MPLVHANLSPILWLAFSHTKAMNNLCGGVESR